MIVIAAHVRCGDRMTGGIWPPRYRRIDRGKSVSQSLLAIGANPDTQGPLRRQRRRLIRTDKTRGEARQIFSMLPVQLGISNISNPHNHKMPQNPSLGDIPSELFVLGHTTSSWIQLE